MKVVEHKGFHVWEAGKGTWSVSRSGLHRKGGLPSEEYAKAWIDVYLGHHLPIEKQAEITGRELANMFFTKAIEASRKIDEDAKTIKASHHLLIEAKRNIDEGHISACAVILQKAIVTLEGNP